MVVEVAVCSGPCPPRSSQPSQETKLKDGTAVKASRELDDRWGGQEYASTNDEEESTGEECNDEDAEEEEEGPQAREAAAAGPKSVAQTEEGAAPRGEAGEAGAGAEAAAAQEEVDDAREEDAACALQLQSIGLAGLVTALASVLRGLASLGCAAHKTTLFHASTAPQISIQEYLARLAKYYHCSEGCLVLGLVYIDRLVKLHSDFVVSNLNIHRLLATGVMLAAKFHDDVFYSNKYYGKVAGVRLQELNKLEETFLRMINWQLYVLPSEYQEYLNRVLLPVQAQLSEAPSPWADAVER